ncbi:MAG: alpha/beta hydrolase family protein [Candidatus Pacebacteria bacterium]|nr:alpha/beta hydrolase family protein [Candidatus Paceibacterota bacterium]
MYNSDIHFKSMYDKAPGQFSFEGSTIDEWSRWGDAFRPALQRALGLHNMATDLQDHQPWAEQVEAVKLEDYSREFWHLWVEPNVPLPFYLLRPDKQTTPAPLVLTPHGHNRPNLYVGIANNPEEEESIKSGDRDIAVQAVKEGYTVIAPTTRAFGETRTNQNRQEDTLHSCRTELMHCLLVGRTVIGERVWDISRLIDWALANLEIDPNRIAITGNSGGGTTSLHAAACDARIAVAVPSCYFCTYVGSIGTIYHCDCNYIPGILRLGEMYDVAGLIAPRPFEAIAGEKDEIFPIQRVRTAFEKLKAIYAAAGAPENCELYVGSEGHRYYKDGAWPFIRKHFTQHQQS